MIVSGPNSAAECYNAGEDKWTWKAGHPTTWSPAETRYKYFNIFVFCKNIIKGGAGGGGSGVIVHLPI